jgi:hypothetical protein
LHRRSQQTRIGDTIAVVTEDSDASLVEVVEMRHVSPGPTHCQSASEVHLGRHISCSTRNAIKYVAGIDSRLSVWHCDNGGKPACDSRGGAGRDVLFPCLTGFSKMDMQVDKARAQNQTAPVNGFEVALSVDHSDLLYMPRIQHDVDVSQPLAGEDPRTSDGQTHFSPKTQESAAILTNTPLAT